MTIVDGLAGRVLVRLILQAHVNDQRNAMVYARFVACLLRQAHVDDMCNAYSYMDKCVAPRRGRYWEGVTSQCVAALE